MNSSEISSETENVGATSGRHLYVLTPVTLGISGASAVRGAISIFFKYSWLIGGILAAFVVAGGVYAFSARPFYRVEVVLAPASSQNTGAGLGAVAGQVGALAALAGLPRLTGANSQEAVAVLESRAFTADFIQERGLLPILFADDWDSQAGRWRFQEGREPALADGVQLFAEDIRRISTDLNTGLVRLSLEWSDPVQVADWANDLVRRLNSVLREREIIDASRSLEYLHRQIAGSDVVEVRSALFMLVEEQEKRRMLASVNDEFAFRVLDPAVVPEVDDPVRPRPILIILVSGIVGLFFGLVAALITELTYASSGHLRKVA